MVATDDSVPDRKNGVQSIEVGMRLLDGFATSGELMTLSALASASGMTPSKAHRYLVSLIRAGYVERDAISGGYRLGTHALSLGLSALRQLEPVRLGAEMLQTLSERTGLTASMAVWGNLGPTVVWVGEASNPMQVTVRPGTVLPLLTSANGQIFLAYMPERVTERIVDMEMRHWQQKDQALGRIDDIRALADTTRMEGRSINDQAVTPGVVSLGAPVFDYHGNLACSIALIGVIGDLEPNWDTEAARQLLMAARDFSKRLGYSGSDLPRDTSTDAS